jgi:hypothetical protein
MRLGILIASIGLLLTYSSSLSAIVKDRKHFKLRGGRNKNMLSQLSDTLQMEKAHNNDLGSVYDNYINAYDPSKLISMESILKIITLGGVGVILAYSSVSPRRGMQYVLLLFALRYHV